MSLLTRNDGTNREARRAQAFLNLPQPVAALLMRYADTVRREALLLLLLRTLLQGCLGLMAIALCDRLLHPPDALRFALSLTLYLWLACEPIVRLRSIFVPKSAGQIALEIERLLPQLDLEERLSTTAELGAHPTGSTLYSQALMQRVANEAAQRIDGLQPGQFVSRKPLVKYALSLGLVLLLVFSSWSAQSHFRTLLLRAAFPWIDLPRPSNTQVNVLTGFCSIVQGEALTIEAQIEGVPAEEVLLQIKESDAWQTYRMQPNETDIFSYRYTHTHAPFVYRIKAGDGTSATYRVEIRLRPEVADMKASILPPSYLPQVPLHAESLGGDLTLLEASTLQLTLDSNVALQAAVLEASGDRRHSMRVDEKRAKIELVCHKTSNYRIRLRSHDGVENPDAPVLQIRTLTDRAPEIQLAKPAHLAVATPEQILPLELRIEDDLGLSSAVLKVRLPGRRKMIEQPLAKPDADEKVWLVAQPWDLNTYLLNPGDLLTWWVEAKDAKGQLTASDERSLRIERSGDLSNEHRHQRLRSAFSAFARVLEQTRAMQEDLHAIEEFLRPQNPDFHRAERHLLNERYLQVQKAIGHGLDALQAVLPELHHPLQRQVLTQLVHALEQAKNLRLDAIASQLPLLKRDSFETIAEGLMRLQALVPGLDERLRELHRQLLHCYILEGVEITFAEMQQLEKELSDQLGPLLGQHGWELAGKSLPGLLFERFTGTNFEKLVDRTVYSDLEILPGSPITAGLPQTTFSIRASGQLYVSRGGTYTFALHADDGVRIYLNQGLLIDLWKDQNLTTTQEFALQKGWHPFKIEFYQREGSYRFELLWSLPGKTPEKIDSTFLRTVGALYTDPLKERLLASMEMGHTTQAVIAADRTVRQLLERLSRQPAQLLERLAPAGSEPQLDVILQKWSAELSMQLQPVLTAATDNPLPPNLLADWPQQQSARIAGLLVLRDNARKALQKAEDDERAYRSKLSGFFTECSTSLQQAIGAWPQLRERQLKWTGQFGILSADDSVDKRTAASVNALAELVTATLSPQVDTLRIKSANTQFSVAERRVLLGLASYLGQTVHSMPDALRMMLKSLTEQENDRRKLGAYKGSPLQRALEKLAKHALEFDRLSQARIKALPFIPALKAAADCLDRPFLPETDAFDRTALQSAEQFVIEALEIFESLRNIGGLSLKNVRMHELRKYLSAIRENLVLPLQLPLYRSVLEDHEKRNELKVVLQEVRAIALDALAQFERAQHRIANALLPDQALTLRSAAYRVETSTQVVLELAYNRAINPDRIRSAHLELKAVVQELPLVAAALALEAEPSMRESSLRGEYQAELLQIASVVLATNEFNLIPILQALTAVRSDEASRLFSIELPREGLAAAERLRTLAQLLQRMQQKQERSAPGELRAQLARVTEESGIQERLGLILEKNSALEELLEKMQTMQIATPTGDALPVKDVSQLDPAAATEARNLLSQLYPAIYPSFVAATWHESLRETRQQANRIGATFDQAKTAWERTLNLQQSLEKERNRTLQEVQQLLSTAYKQLPTQWRADREQNFEQTARHLSTLQKRVAAVNKTDSRTIHSDLQPLAPIKEELRTVLGKLGRFAASSTDHSPGLQQAGRKVSEALGLLTELNERQTLLEQSARRALQRTRTAQLQALGETHVWKTLISRYEDRKELDRSLGSLTDNTELLRQRLQLKSEEHDALAALQALIQQHERFERLQNVLRKLDVAAPAESGLTAQLDAPALNALQQLARAEVAAALSQPLKQAESATHANLALAMVAQSIRTAIDESSVTYESERMLQGKTIPHVEALLQPAPQTLMHVQSEGPTDPEKLVRLPSDLPIDRSTWNRLPDNVRKDLMNATGNRIPPEFERQIRLYFQNLARTQE